MDELFSFVLDMEVAVSDYAAIETALIDVAVAANAGRYKLYFNCIGPDIFKSDLMQAGLVRILTISNCSKFDGRLKLNIGYRLLYVIAG